LVVVDPDGDELGRARGQARRHHDEDDHELEEDLASMLVVAQRGG
jgi:hypothetical protein